jgi:hypothetical protein
MHAHQVPPDRAAIALTPAPGFKNVITEVETPGGQHRLDR